MNPNTREVIDVKTEEEKLMSASNVGKKIGGGINLSGSASGARRTTFSSESEGARPLARPLTRPQVSSDTGNPQGIKTIKRKDA
jgi:hypothetical protein